MTWAQLRSTFNRILAQLKLRPYGTAEFKRPRWYLYHHMHFLKDHVAHGSVLADSIPYNATLPTSHSVTFSMSELEENSQSSEPEVSLVDIEPYLGSNSRSGDSLPPDEPGGNGTETWQTAGLKIEDQLSDASTSFSSVSQSQDKTQTSRKKRVAGYDPVQEAFVELIRNITTAIQPQRAHEEESKELSFFKGLVPYLQQMTEVNKRAFIKQTTSLCMELLDNQRDQEIPNSHAEKQ